METSDPIGKLYLIPSLMGEVAPLEVLPLSIKKVLDLCDHYIVENEKTARAFIKKVKPDKSQSRLVINVLNKYTDEAELPRFLDAALDGNHIGLLSEAGAPSIADPGSEIVKLAHRQNIRTVPLVGPSSIFMALMASGMNGQYFAFNGYLPIDKKERRETLKALERRSRESGQAQIFMETPYRNEKLLDDVLKNCRPETRLCIAREISTPTEFIRTKTIADWQNQRPDLEKRPTIFVLEG